MKSVVININDIKEIKKLMIEVQEIKDNNYRQGDYSYNYNGKEDIISEKEENIIKNIQAVISILPEVGYNTVVDMCNDFDFAAYVIEDIYKNRAA